jgi:hypothetical protein
MTDSSQPSSNLIARALSRRDLFRTAGLAAGGAVLLGLPKMIGNWTTEAQAALSRPGYTAGKIALELDGVFVGYLKSVEGGNAFTDVLPEAVGPDLVQRKRPGPVQYEDIVMEVPLGTLTLPFRNWITEMLTKGPTPKNGVIMFANFNNAELKRLEFFNAVLTEVALPTCEAGSKEVADLTLRLGPQSTRLTGGSGKTLPSAGVASKVVHSGNFQFEIGLVDRRSIRKVNRITAKRPLVGITGGRGGVKQPSALDCSMVSIVLPETVAGPFYKWFNDMVAMVPKGNPPPERDGHLEWLDPGMKSVLFSVEFGGLGIVRYTPLPADPAASTTSMVQVDMYCETMNLTL